MSEPIDLAPSSTPITEEIGSVGWWVNKEALPLLRALRESVNHLILNPELRETGGPTDIPMGAVADGELLMRVGNQIVGAPAAAPTRSVSIRGYQSRDQGGASTNGVTRHHIAGYANTGAVFVSQTTAGMQSVGAGQMAYAIPEYFEKAGVITRLSTRTDGKVGATTGDSRLRMAVYAEGSLASGVLSGSPFPGARLGQSASINMQPGGAFNILESHSLSIPVAAGTYAWFTVMYNNDAVTNQWSVPAMGYLYPIQGFTFRNDGTSIALDARTSGVGWRHAVTFGTTEDFPDPFPQSAPAILTDPVHAGSTANIPVIGYGFQAT